MQAKREKKRKEKLRKQQKLQQQQLQRRRVPSQPPPPPQKQTIIKKKPIIRRIRLRSPPSKQRPPPKQAPPSPIQFPTREFESAKSSNTPIIYSDTTKSPTKNNKTDQLTWRKTINNSSEHTPPSVSLSSTPPSNISLSQPKLNEFPQIILPLAIEFPPHKSRSMKVQNIPDVVRSLMSRSNQFQCITLTEVLERKGKLGEQLWLKISAKCEKKIILEAMFQIIYAIAILKIHTKLKRSVLRIVLCGFNNFNAQDISLLRKVLRGDQKDLKAHTFRLGLLVLDANPTRLIKKWSKALENEKNNDLEDEIYQKVEEWHKKYTRVINEFKDSDVCRVTRMCECGRIADECMMFIFGTTTINDCFDGANKLLDEAHDTIELFDDQKVQTTSGEAQKGDKIIRVSRNAFGNIPLPPSALHEHASPHTYAGRFTNTQQHEQHEQQHALPNRTKQNMNQGVYHLMVGWLSVMGIESGHPDDWDRTFSNAYLFGKIIAAFETTFPLSQMRTAYSSVAKEHNWILLSHSIKTQNIKGVTPMMRQNAKSASPGSAICILQVLYHQLHTRQTVRKALPRLGRGERHSGSGSETSPRAITGGGSLWEREQANMLRRTEQLL